jgi:hypothetical protein
VNDEQRQRNKRAAKQGDGMAAVREQVEQARVGDGIAGFLAGLIGKMVYVEGVRINYRGTLQRVFYHGDGAVSGLVLNPCQRVSYFEKTGPQASYTYTHTKERLIPYEVVHDVGEEGFVEGAWKALPES